MLFQLNNANYLVGEGLVPSQPPEGDHPGRAGKGLPYILDLLCWISTNW